VDQLAKIFIEKSISRNTAPPQSFNLQAILVKIKTELDKIQAVLAKFLKDNVA